MFVCLVAQSCPTLCEPMSCSPAGSSIHGDSPGKNIGVGCHALLQVISPTQGWNPGLLHCRQILYHLSHQGCPLNAWLWKKKREKISDEDSLQNFILNIMNLIIQYIIYKMKKTRDFSGWASCSESTLQCRGCGFNPWLRTKILHAAEKLSPCVTTTEAHTLHSAHATTKIQHNQLNKQIHV